MDDPDDRGQLLLELAALGQELDSRLGDHDLSLEIERTLGRRGASPHRNWLDSRRRRVVAVLVVGVACVVAVPPARAAINQIFRIGAITEEPSSTVATTITAPRAPSAPSANPDRFAGLGDQTTLANLREQGLPALAPTADDLGPPEVRFESTNGPHTSLLYRSRSGVPEIPGTDGAGLLIEEFVGDGRTMVRKYLSDRTVAEPIDIDGNPGVYLSGGSHLVFYEDPLGRDIQADGRTVGSALIFQRDDLTIRIEGNLDRDRMVGIARTLQ